MAYSTFETSSHDGAPIEGFYFIGAAHAYRYTNAQRDQNINGLVYTAAGIKRAGIKSGTQDDDSLELSIELPIKLSLVQTFAFAASPPDLTLTLYRFHEGSNPASDWVIIFKGNVTGYSVSDKMCTLRVPAVFESALRGNVPSVFYHQPCNHVLYDARCKVVRAPNMTTTTVQSISVDGLSITVVNDGFADNFLKSGAIYIPTKGERRQIVSNLSNVVAINFPFFNVQVGDTVELDAGCDHQYQGDCKNKFANTINYGGFPHVPKENPFSGSL